MNEMDSPAVLIAGVSTGLSALTGGITYAKGVKKAKDIVKENTVTLANCQHVAVNINYCPPVDEFIKNAKKSSLKKAGKLAGLVLAAGGVFALVAEVFGIRNKLNNHLNKNAK